MGEADDVVMVPGPCRVVESHGPWAAADVQASAHATYLTPLLQTSGTASKHPDNPLHVFINAGGTR